MINRFIDYYEKGFMPWAHEEPDFNLVEMVDNWPIKLCKTLEVGCGTGTDSVWLSQMGFKQLPTIFHQLQLRWQINKP